MSQGAFSQRRNGSASFRDPSGSLLLTEGRALRLVNNKGAAELKSFLATTVAQNFVDAGHLVSTTFLDASADLAPFPNAKIKSTSRANEESILAEHERIAVQSFPYEWPPEMLHAAGALMLDLADGALTECYSLKDATPYNVLFRGPRPVFVDLLSFEKRDPRDPTWLPFNQFVRTILLPLLVNKYFGLRLDQLLTVNRDGLEPAEVAPLCGPLRRLHPLFLTLVSLPHWLSAKLPRNEESIYRRTVLANPEKARFILRQQFKRLRTQLAKVEPRANRVSAWSDYMTPAKFFSADYLIAKEAFVAQTVDQFKPRRVLDVGCNTGHFSCLAAQGGARVVAIDQDPAVVGAVWRRARAQNLDVLPLVVNLARPTPAFGWRNEECPSFLERVRGGFDMVLMLAVLHHLLVTEQIPLTAVIELAAELTSDLLLVEFVAPEDPLFRRLVRGREELFCELTRELFEETAAHWFEVLRTQRLHQTRWLYLLRRRNAKDA